MSQQKTEMRSREAAAAFASLLTPTAGYASVFHRLVVQRLESQWPKLLDPSLENWSVTNWTPARTAFTSDELQLDARTVPPAAMTSPALHTPPTTCLNFLILFLS